MTEKTTPAGYWQMELIANLLEFKNRCVGDIRAFIDLFVEQYDARPAQRIERLREVNDDVC